MLTKVWAEFPEVRFVQWEAPAAPQPVNPHYGDYRGLEGAKCVEGISYSVNQNECYDAKLIPKQIKDATYLVNVALLKAHSYPYSSDEGGDEGQTGVTMTGKNLGYHFKTGHTLSVQNRPTGGSSSLLVKRFQGYASG